MTSPFKNNDIDNVNALALVNSITFLIDIKQWNDMMKWMAAMQPKDFIKVVEEYRENGQHSHLFAPTQVAVWLENTDFNNKIGSIKVCREMFGLGLADAKMLVERAPVNLITVDNNSNDLAFIITKLDSVSAKVRIRVPRDDSVSCFKTVSVDAGYKAPINFKYPEIY